MTVILRHFIIDAMVHHAENFLSLSYEAILLTANVTDGNVKSVEFLVNGIKLGVVSVTDKKAQMQVAESTLVPTGSYNTVQIFGLGK